MAFSLDTIFTTATSLPPSVTGMREVLPCAALRPYVRCFWEADKDCKIDSMRIIPDCCSDIIFDGTTANYCGASTHSFISQNVSRVFGIRFYAWGAALFTPNDIRGTLNGYFLANTIFDGIDALCDRISETQSFDGRVEIAQKYLLSVMANNRSDADVMNALYYIVESRGKATAGGSARRLAVSTRTLERKFMGFTGMSPKQAADLIRYQLLWQACMQERFCALDNAYELGYYDVSHMYRDFEKFHGLPLSTARDEYKTLSHFYNTRRV